MIVFNLLLYYLIIIPVSLLPFRLLYLFSDFLYLVLYRMAGYRTKVVRKNLCNSFPEKSADELKKIEHLFYHHLCDVIVETLKSFTISEKEILRRMVLENPELPDQYFDAGRSILLAGGHYNNWEWIATSLDQQIKHKTYALYTPLSNLFFERKMQKTRSKFGLTMISISQAAKFFETHRNELTATIFGTDQSPRNPERCYWMNFLNQETGVLFGLEKYAKSYNQPVLFCDIEKIKRGYYSIRFSLVTDHPWQNY
jgi:KDO2-lipid IV(A) lauroyltransferase